MSFFSSENIDGAKQKKFALKGFQKKERRDPKILKEHQVFAAKVIFPWLHN